jgi:hypothetical protein
MIASIKPAVWATTPKASNCFVYGTLMASEVVEALIGRAPQSIPDVVLQNHLRYPVKGQVYPAVIPSTVASNDERNNGNIVTNTVEGILLLNLSPLELQMFDFFEEEGVDYIRKRVEVCIQNTSMDNVKEFFSDESSSFTKSRSNDEFRVETNAYIWAKGEDTLDLSNEWDYEAFRKYHLKQYLECTVKPCRKEFINERNESIRDE